MAKHKGTTMRLKSILFVLCMILGSPKYSYAILGGGDVDLLDGNATSVTSMTETSATYEDDEGGQESTGNNRSHHCNDENNGRRIGLRFLKRISAANDRGMLKFKLSKDKRKIRLEMPRHISACLKIKLKAYVAGSNIFVRMENVYDFAEDNGGKDIDERYFNCIKDKKEIVKLNSNGTYGIDFPTAKKKNLLNNSSIIEEELVTALDPNRTYSLVVASAVSSSFKGNKTKKVKGSLPKGDDWSCLNYENPYKKNVVLQRSINSRRIERERLFCQENKRNLPGIYQKISELYEERESSDSVGNLDEIIKFYEAFIDTTIANEEDVLYDEIKDVEKEIRQAIKDGNIDEDSAEELVKSYQEKLELLNKQVILPLIHKLGEKLEERKREAKKGTRATAKSRSEEIDDEIEKLNRRIGKFAKLRGKKSLANDPMLKIMARYNLIDEAERVEEIRLFSDVFSRVYIRRNGGRRSGPRIRYEKGIDRIEKEKDKYRRRRENEWADMRDVSDGSYTPIHATTRKARRVMQELEHEAARFEQINKRQALRKCAVRNSLKCREFLESYHIRREQYMKPLTRRYQELVGHQHKLVKAFEHYRDIRRSESGDDEDWDRSYEMDRFFFDYEDPGYNNHYSFSSDSRLRMMRHNGMSMMDPRGMYGMMNSPYFGHQNPYSMMGGGHLMGGGHMPSPYFGHQNPYSMMGGGHMPYNHFSSGFWPSQQRFGMPFQQPWQSPHMMMGGFRSPASFGGGIYY